MGKKKKKVDEIIAAFHNDKNKIPSDTLGSYTGTSSIENEKPVQDADDI